MAQRDPDVHLNLRVRGLSPSATVAINERSNELIASGHEVFKLGLGQSPFPVPDVVVEALRTHAAEKDYLPVKGLRALRDEVATYHNVRGIKGDGDDVLIGPGSKELMFLLQLVYYGDIVLPSPSWVSYAPQADIIGRKVRWVHTRKEDHWRLTANLLESLCNEDPERPRIVLLNYPSNPTGGSLDAVQLEELADVARRYRVVLLSDEIYGELDHAGAHKSIGTLYPEGTIVSSGLSKWCGAGGWRLGTFMFPKSMRWLLDAMSVVASETYTSTCAPIQYAAVRAFQGGDMIDSYLVDSRKVLSALGSWCAATLRGAGARVTDPVGGFYLFPDLSPLRDKLAARGIHDSETLCARLLDDTGVAILPGSSFGRPAEELNVRIAYVDFNGTEALKAVHGLDAKKRDEAFVRAVAPKVVTAFERMAEWLSI
jgi:aspartate aminotransferase